ncbi:hypothetical protein ACHAXS_001569, partial [Conticribra weissflogii]
DADFAGLYRYKDGADPTCTRSRTGFTIAVADCPVFWQSKLQTETALSTMEAEVVAFVACCRELFPNVDIVDQIGNAVGLSHEETCRMHIKMHEDNAGALTLLTTPPPQYTPRSKHYAIKTNWFCEQIIAYDIKVVKIDTKEQRGDIFTKSLPEAIFKYLRKKIMGW